MKKPLSLVLQSLRRSRHADAGAWWLGLSRGRPLPDAPRRRMWEILEGLDWAAMPNEVRVRAVGLEPRLGVGVGLGLGLGLGLLTPALTYAQP